MLRVLAYHQLDDHAVQKIMSEAVGTLKGLSNQQMTEILKNFDTAAQSKTLADMDKQLDLAQDKHRVVLDQLRTLLNRFELMRNLDQAAMRIDKLAFEEKSLRERMVLAEQLRRQQQNQRRGMRPESPQQLALKQEDITRESKAILQKLDELKHELPDELKPRIEKVASIINERKMQENMTEAAMQIRHRNQRDAEDRHHQTSWASCRKPATAWPVWCSSRPPPAMKCQPARTRDRRMPSRRKPRTVNISPPASQPSRRR
jgi:hypothetical protein